MNELIAQAAAWLHSVLAQVPPRIRAIYVEYGDAYTPKMVHFVCFDAFGFESLAGGRFDPSNEAHVGELGDFSWEASKGCEFQADHYPATDWMEVLKGAARKSEVQNLAAVRGLQLLVGEHDGDVFVMRSICMSPTLQELKDAASGLPAGERAELAQFLLDTLDEPDEQAVRSEWLALAEQRMADVRAGKVIGVPAEQVVKNLLEPKR